MLLAASIPARPGEFVLEGGTGAGAGLLCLAARVPEVNGLGVEIDPAMADLALRNCKANGFDTLDILTASILHAPREEFDHAFANPPWHDPGSTPSPNPRRQLAKQATGPGLEGWIAALRRTLRPGGTVTVILPAAQVARGASAMRFFGLGGITQTLLVPKANRPAKLALLSGRIGDRGADRVNPAIVLHAESGAYTPEVEAVLRGGLAMPTEMVG